MAAPAPYRAAPATTQAAPAAAALRDFRMDSPDLVARVSDQVTDCLRA
ncbi:hypothetical protein GPN2_12367 [Streptomyces murinus]